MANLAQQTVELFSFQGSMYTSIRDTVTGRPQKLLWLGNVQEAKIDLTPAISDKYESFSGNRLLYGRLMKEKKGVLSIVGNEMLWEALTLSLYCNNSMLTGAAVTNEVAEPASGVASGDMIATQFPNISALTVKDSAGSPATLVLGTDYKIVSSTRGIIQFLSTVPGTFVQPFKLNYTWANVQNFPMFTQATPPERYVVFDGVNTVDGENVNVELYRCQFLPAKQFGLIDPDWGTLQLEAAILYDSINAANSNMGGFGVLRAT